MGRFWRSLPGGEAKVGLGAGLLGHGHGHRAIRRFSNPQPLGAVAAGWRRAKGAIEASGLPGARARRQGSVAVGVAKPPSQGP
jgi:hypothetical protein